MAEMIRNQLKSFIDQRLDDTKDWMNNRFDLFEKQTTQQLGQIEQVINSKAMDTGQFNQELKNEMELLEDKHRKATMEHL